jgi:uncharacterized protein (TIGR00730 family)
MSTPQAKIGSVCVYCGSSPGADPAYVAAAASLGRELARADVRLIYGGGGVGLMGACARAARAAGGRVLGVIPAFLAAIENPPPTVETLVVETMHERKMKMFEEADAFVVLPGGIGTLEEAIELLSWRRLGLHAKPIVFYSPGGFWDPLFHLFVRFAGQGLVPAAFADCWRAVASIEDVLPTVLSMPADVFADTPMVDSLT